MKHFFLRLSLIFCLCLMAKGALAASTLPVSGLLTDADGNPIEDGEIEIRMTLCDPDLTQTYYSNDGTGSACTLPNSGDVVNTTNGFYSIDYKDIPDEVFTSGNSLTLALWVSTDGSNFENVALVDMAPSYSAVNAHYWQGLVPDDLVDWDSFTLDNLNGEVSASQMGIFDSTGKTMTIGADVNDAAFIKVDVTNDATDPYLTYSVTNNRWELSNDGDTSNAIQTTTLNSGQIWIGNNSNTATAATISGDATISNTGVLSIGNDKIRESHLKAINGPTDEFCLTYETTTGDFEWQNCTAGAGDITDVLAGNGINVTNGAGPQPTVALGALTGNWNQSGAFDVILNNANSELQILESAGATFYGTIDVTDLTANRTYTFPNASGTVALTTSNVATATALAANGANCIAGQYARGVDAFGAAENCTADDDTPDNDGEVPDDITIASTGKSQVFTFGAANNFTLDAISTANTTTNGIINLDIGAGDAAVDGINVELTVNDGATAGQDYEAMAINLMANDADADLFGITITTSATPNAGAGSYEAGIRIDNVENTANAMTDGILITSSGFNNGIQDAIDVSNANITNAINIGGNPIVTGNVAGSIGDPTTDSWTFLTDGTGDAEINLPNDSIGAAEILDGAVNVADINAAIAGNGLTGGGGAALAVGAGSGISVAANSVALGNLTAEWSQSGAFDVTLNNADSELRILESAGATFYGTIDVGDLSADRTYNFPDAGGTVALTTSNVATATALAANGGNCIAGQYARGVDASGAAENCTADDDIPDSDGEVPDDITIASTAKSQSFTFGAANNFTLDATSTANTTTNGIIDLNIGAGDAVVDGINIGLTVNDGATAAQDYEGMVIGLTANDADADLFGITITTSATANAGAGSYEAGIRIDNVENTANAMTDGILITSSGFNNGIQDGLDVSDGNLTNAINVGDNTILGTTAVINFTNFDVVDGDITNVTDIISDGQLSITNANNENVIAVTANTVTTSNVITMTANGNLGADSAILDINAGGDLNVDTAAVNIDVTTAADKAFRIENSGTENFNILGNGDMTSANHIPKSVGNFDLGSPAAEWKDIYVGDNTGLRMGLDQDAALFYDETTDDRVELTGPNASLYIEDRLILGKDNRTIADSGDASPATLTLEPTASWVTIVCNDFDGCDVTMGETTPHTGQIVTITKTGGAGEIQIDNTVGVSELTSPQWLTNSNYDNITLLYIGTTWIELNRSNVQ